MAGSEGIFRSGDYNLINLDLYATEDFAGPPVSLKDLFLEFHIFEDSQRPFMYGHITIQDAIGLFSKLPILGEETIYIKFETPNKEPIEVEANIYKVTDRQRIGTNSQMYVLHWVSKEYIQGLQTPISRSYKDLKAHEIAKELYDEYMKIEDYSIRQTKELFTEDMLDPQWVVFPYWTPEQCLTFMAGKSVSEEYFEGDPVIFFEDRRGFHFRTMRQLIWDEDVTPGSGEEEKLYYTSHPSAPGDTDDASGSMLRVSNMRVVSSTDTVQRMMGGYYKSKTMNIDWERHLIHEKDYHIIQDFDLNQRVYAEGEQFAFNTDTFMNKIKRDAHVRLIQTRWGQKDDGGIAGMTEETFDFDKFEHISKRINREYKGITVEATVPGNTVRKLFDTITLDVEEPDATAKEKDKYLSGRYYINAIHHIITPGNYEHVVECVKDALGKKLERE